MFLDIKYVFGYKTTNFLNICFLFQVSTKEKKKEKRNEFVTNLCESNL